MQMTGRSDPTLEGGGEEQAVSSGQQAHQQDRESVADVQESPDLEVRRQAGAAAVNP